MAKYHKSALTAAGLALANRAAKGQATFKITKATSTADTIEDTAIAGLVKLPNEVQVGTITGDQPLSDGDGTVTGTKVLFTNHNLQTSYQIHAVGLYAVENDGDEFLYAVVPAIEPEFMPDFSDQVLMEFGMTIYVVVGQVDNMSVIINPDSLATVAYVDKAIADHQVVFPETLTYRDHNEVVTGKWMFKGGAVDGEGNSFATSTDLALYQTAITKKIADGDSATLRSANVHADADLTTSKAYTDSVVKPLATSTSVMQGDTNTLTSAKAYADSKASSTLSTAENYAVKDNRNGTVTVNGQIYTPANDAYAIKRNDAGNTVGTVKIPDGNLQSSTGLHYYPIQWFGSYDEAMAYSKAHPYIDCRW